jgi:hypothetical protein
METPAPASTENLPAVKPQPVTSTRPPLTSRQEAFCHAMAGGVGGAEAARRAGYSGNGAKQRGAFLMRQPEIRVRIDEIRASRQADHQAQLDEADQQVSRVIDEAFETNRPALALRAIEFRLKLCGVIQDKRIAHHYYGCLDNRAHPDADLEGLDGDPEEELDSIRFRPGFAMESAAKDADRTPAVTFDDLPALSAPAPALPPPPQTAPRLEAPQPAAPARKMTYVDLSREIEKMTSEFSSLLESTALTSPVPAFRSDPIRGDCQRSLQ